MLEAVIFDVDGLIIDSEPLHLQAYNDILENYGIKISENEYSKIVGNKTEIILKYIKTKYSINESIDVLLSLKNSRYQNLKKNNTVPRDGVLDLITKIYSKQYKLAIATSSNRKETNDVLSFLELTDKFDIVVSEDDVNYVKPNPEIFNFISNKLNISASNCVVLEDSERGIMAAKLAKMKCIAVPNSITKNNDFSSADIVVENFNQISIEILEDVAKSY